MTKPFELDIFCDASEIGWGAFMLRMEVTGLFGASVVGKSSTFREISGLINCFLHEEVRLSTRGKALRVNMDSRPAVANLTKNGGPVPELCALIKVLYAIWSELDISATFRWLSRDSMEMKKADALSKAFSYTLKESARVALSSSFQCDIFCPLFGQIPNELAVIVMRKRVCGMVVPVWEAKSWWTQMVAQAKHMVRLSKEHLVFRGTSASPDWEFAIALFF